jgi:hypothetical protein
VGDKAPGTSKLAEGEFAYVMDLNSPFYGWAVEVLQVLPLASEMTPYKRAAYYYKVKPVLPATWSHDAYLTFNENQLN